MVQRILLGITGSIAAYKAAELVRRLRQAGCEVRVVMTQGAQAFITPLTLQSLSGHRVFSQQLDPESEAAMDHISLAKWADCVLVAPASANFLARLAHGLADDLLTTLCLATAAPVYVAPAMNQQMWRNTATANNIATLVNNHIKILGPAVGDQACGDIGPGRMLEPEALLHALRAATEQPDLSQLNVLITAGPTREALDPVRFLSNRSSGKMGYALARAFANSGARVTLVSGPVSLAKPVGATVVPVESAEQMHEAVQTHLAKQHLFIACAAVADYRPVAPQQKKIKKDKQDTLTLELERNPDILALVARQTPRPYCVGFAAETHDLEKYARDKLTRKQLDMVVANVVGGPSGGFEADENSVTVFWHDGKTELPLASKDQIAMELRTIIMQGLARNTPAAARDPE